MRYPRMEETRIMMKDKRRILKSRLVVRLLVLLLASASVFRILGMTSIMTTTRSSVDSSAPNESARRQQQQQHEVFESNYRQRQAKLQVQLLQDRQRLVRLQGGLNVPKRDPFINEFNRPQDRRQQSSLNVTHVMEGMLANYSICRGKESFLKIVIPTVHQIHLERPQQLCEHLPRQEQVDAIFGPEPIIHGLDTCANYRALIKSKNVQPKPRIAGLYHCGTNAMTRTFDLNLGPLPRPAKFRDHAPYNVPWGKHVPFKYQFNNTDPVTNPDDKTLVLPIVLIRDPFYWMQSMCKEGYDAVWDRKSQANCPALLNRSGNGTVMVNVTTQQTKYRFSDVHASLSDFWSDWYLQYYNSPHPRLIIRFEDILYRLEKVLTMLRTCLGLEQQQLRILTGRAKRHGHPTDYVTALGKYVSGKGRLDGLQPADVQYAHTSLNATLMTTFGYPFPESSSSSSVPG